ncbi:MAG: SsrA-binding protein SmpB [Thermoanaerobaculia bacterium]
MPKKKPPGRLLAVNRRARHDYHLLERFEAGIALTGTEVKAAREGRVQLKDSYIEIRDGEAYLQRAHISPYSHGDRNSHAPERPRKLLLKRREIDKIFGRTTIQGQTCVPLAAYLKGNLIKLEIALAKGKKLYDKRQEARARVLDEEAREAIG